MVKNANVEKRDTLLEERNTLNLLEVQYRKSWASADSQMRQAQAIMLEYGDADGTISDPALFQQYRNHMASSAAALKQAKTAKKLFRAHSQTVRSLTVRNEPSVYTRNGPNSYFVDVAACAAGAVAGNVYEEAKERQTRYAAELNHEIRSGSKRGAAIINAVRERYRTTDGNAETHRAVVSRVQEVRAGTTTSLAGFVTPAWIQELAAIYRAPTASFSNLARHIPLPAFGLEVDFGGFTTAPTVGTQNAENSGVDNLDPAGANVGPIPVETFAGQVNISQQLFDRGRSPGALGGSFDQTVLVQMQSQLDAAVSLYVIQQALVNATVITEGSTWTIPLLWSDTSTAAEKLADNAGTRFPGTHVFSTTDLLRWATKQTDATTNRPVIIPDATAIEVVRADATQGGVGSDDGYSGVLLPGGLRWHTDDNIPAQTGHPTYAQFIVAQMSEVLVFDGDPISFAYPESDAVNLTVAVGLRKYVASSPRYGKAVAVVNGAGLASLS